MRAGRALTAAGAALAVAAAAVSGPSSRVAWTPETVTLARSGDPAKGKKLHEDCSGCHGPTGNVDVPDIPNLAGQNPLYLFKQLQHFKSGRRPHKEMRYMSRHLTDEEMLAISQYYSRMTR